MPVIMNTIHPFLFVLNQSDTNMPRRAEGWMLAGY